ncbi:FKBP-type peptidyl-prolyl cis-trans isomerase [Ekhidna sp.]
MKEIVLGVVLALVIASCGEGDVAIITDPSIQAEKDSVAIAEYLEINGFLENQIGTATNGVRYVILDSGSVNAADRIDESDQVNFNYIGKTLGDTIFDTSIEVIGDSLQAYYEENPFVIDNDTISVFTGLNYEPLFITYSSSAWTIPTGDGGFVAGFANGIAGTFKHLGIGGKAIILIPSGQAYGERGIGVFIGSNAPILFELQPVSVTKQ